MNPVFTRIEKGRHRRDVHELACETRAHFTQVSILDVRPVCTSYHVRHGPGLNELPCQTWARLTRASTLRVVPVYTSYRVRCGPAYTNYFVGRGSGLHELPQQTWVRFIPASACIQLESSIFQEGITSLQRIPIILYLF